VPIVGNVSRESVDNPKVLKRKKKVVQKLSTRCPKNETSAKVFKTADKEMPKRWRGEKIEDDDESLRSAAQSHEGRSPQILQLIKSTVEQTPKSSEVLGKKKITIKSVKGGKQNDRQRRCSPKPKPR